MTIIKVMKRNTSNVSKRRKGDCPWIAPTQANQNHPCAHVTPSLIR